MDPYTIAVLAEVGFSVADRVLAMNKDVATPGAPPLATTVRDIVETSSASLAAAIRSASDRIVEKLESDKLEELQARVKNVSMLLRMRREAQLLQPALTLNESVEYAQNRLREGKLDWLGPWLAGKAVFLAAMRACDAMGGDEFSEFEAEVASGRRVVLDWAAPILLHSNGRLPWDAIAAFMAGEPPAFLKEFQRSVVTAPAPPRDPRAPRACPSCRGRRSYGTSCCQAHGCNDRTPFDQCLVV